MRDFVVNMPPAATNEVDLTPMLDVVFIMLIFFIVTASFIKEVGLDVSRSEDSFRTPTESQSILVTIDQDSLLWIDQRMIDPRAMRANIFKLHAENPDASVIILADKRSSNKALVQVMDASRQAGVYDISVAAEEK
jgi:biopolymer transport protein ExbD